MDALIAFLNARLAEDEQIARACLDEVGGTFKGEMYHDGSGVADRDDYPSYPWGSGEAELAFVARHDPARVLREVEAKRETLRLHGRMSITPGHPMFNDAHLTTVPMVICRSCEPEHMFRRAESWPCRTMRALALAYADHPGYQESWRP